MDKSEWILRWKNWIKPTRYPGVWRRRDGGCVVRARARDPLTGRLKEVKKVLPMASEAEASAWLEQQLKAVREGLAPDQRRRQPFGDFAVSLLDRKRRSGEVGSTASHSRWKHTLEHLIGGTSDEKATVYVPGFGDLAIGEIRRAHVLRWKTDVTELLIRPGHYAPTTANGWLSKLRVVMRAAHFDLELPHLATDGVTDFDTREHETYTAEAPNALPYDKIKSFLDVLRARTPQHYAMVLLGLSTGLRPSQLRPLRRLGKSADINWDTGTLQVRRSQTRGDEVMNRTKQGTRYTVTLPSEVVDVLRWHVDTQLHTPAQQASELLFPATTGGFRAPTVLNKPLAAASKAAGLGFTFTQRGMRRTFNDLARAAEVKDVVTRSISGHATETMQQHYSTVWGAEQREGIAKVYDLMGARGGAPSGAPDAEVVLQSKKAG